MLVWNILTTFASRVVIMMLALASSVILARFLGPDGRGLFALVLLLPECARTLGLLGFEQSNVVYAGLQPNNRHILVWHSVLIAATVGISVGVAGILFISLGAPGFPSLLRGPRWIYWIPFSVMPFALASDYLGSILRGMNRIFVINVLDVGTKIGSLVLVLGLVGWLRLEVPGAVWADFITQVAYLVITVCLLAYGDTLGPLGFDRALFSRSTRFALPAHCSTVLSYLNYRVDQFFIAAWLPPEQLGFYVIAVGLAERLWVPTGAIATALLPHLTNSAERDPALPAILARHVMIWVGLACFLVFVLADVMVEILYSSAFASAADALRWLLPGIFSLSVGRVLVAELLAREKPRYMVWGSGVSTLINIAGNFLLVPRMGITGSAIASSVSYSLLALVLIRYYLRETGLPYSALLPRPNDLVVYASLRSIAADYWLSKGEDPKPSSSEVQPQACRELAAVSIPGQRQNDQPLHSGRRGVWSILSRKILDFYDNPHFPYFLLVPIRKISPTLARYLRYRRYNLNTEAYWNERYRLGSYQIEQEWRYQSLDHEIIQLVTPGSKILDAGCGTGRIMEKLRDQRNCTCVGVDISDVAVNHVRAKGFCGFKCALPKLASELAHKKFDVCTITETLEHLTSPHRTLESLSTLLKDGGSFIVSVPDDCMKPAEFDEHVVSFNKDSLCDLLGQYCEVEQVLSLEAGGNNHLIVRGRK
jgi:O-antigen/teichoic acid export membrane protein/ubiquinone/menaquinone biosynthesis C-methylase UbiE